MEVMGKPWKTIYGRFSNPLQTLGALEAFVSPGWSVLWRELMIWQTEASTLPSGHWATVHAALLASYLAMRRHSQGFPLPILAWCNWGWGL